MLISKQHLQFKTTNNNTQSTPSRLPIHFVRGDHHQELFHKHLHWRNRMPCSGDNGDIHGGTCNTLSCIGGQGTWTCITNNDDNECTRHEQVKRWYTVETRCSWGSLMNWYDGSQVPVQRIFWGWVCSCCTWLVECVCYCGTMSWCHLRHQETTNQHCTQKNYWWNQCSLIKEVN